MILYPAIDLLDGRVVRLAKGDFDAVTDYGEDPLATARAYAAAGAAWLHLVDLSGARDGARRQAATVESISGAGLNVQTGGGVRRAADVQAILDAGAARAVVGSLAVTDPARVTRWLQRFGADRLTLAFDVTLEQGEARPRVAGWTECAAVTLDSLVETYADAGLAHALVTDIGRDGMLAGPNDSLYRRLVRTWPHIAWQASGGIADTADLARLRDAGLSGAIIGRALYEGRFTLAEALAEAAPC